jgi:hypothetical protein
VKEIKEDPIMSSLSSARPEKSEPKKSEPKKSEPVSLWEALGEVPDPRSRLGQRHPLQAILVLSAVAVLSGAKSLYAIAQFGRDRCEGEGKDEGEGGAVGGGGARGGGFAAALGFTRERTPCCGTLFYLFQDLDREAFEAAIRRWARGRCEAAGWEALHLDGKTLRGIQGHEVPGVHLLAAYAHEAKTVLEQIPVGAKTNEHKAALELLGLLPRGALEGKVVTGDALFCQRDLSKQVVKKGAPTSGR